MKKVFTLTIIFICILSAAIIVYKYFSKQRPEMNHIEKTFAIIKPDAVASKHSGKIIDIIEKNGFEIIRLKKITLSKDEAQKFYEEHKERGFFKDLVDFMTSGPVIIMVLEKQNAIVDWRNLMGATNPAEAEQGTIRKSFGTDKGKNATHGSDSQNAAKREIGQFFPELVSSSCCC